MGLLPESVMQNFDFGMPTLIGNWMIWLGYGLLMLLVIFGVIVFYYYLQFKFSVTIYPLVGSGNTTELAVGKPKKNRFKWNRNKTAWKAMFPLFNKKEIEPFDPKYIYQGNRLVAFKLGEEYIPGCINIDQKESRITQAQINPVPHYIRNWQSMEHKKNAIEFAKNDWWTNNKMIVTQVIAVAICAAMVLGTVYMAYKFLSPTASGLNSLTEAIKGFGNIQGIAPG